MTESNQTDEDDGGQKMPVPKRPVLTLDVALYEHMLADSDLTDGQKQEFLQELWSIIVAFVDLGFGVHPLQQARREHRGHVHGCGQNREMDDLSAVIAADVLSSTDTEQSRTARSGEAQTAFTGAKEES